MIITMRRLGRPDRILWKQSEFGRIGLVDDVKDSAPQTRSQPTNNTTFQPEPDVTHRQAVETTVNTFVSLRFKMIDFPSTTTSSKQQ